MTHLLEAPERQGRAAAAPSRAAAGTAVHPATAHPAVRAHGALQASANNGPGARRLAQLSALLNPPRVPAPPVQRAASAAAPVQRVVGPDEGWPGMEVVLPDGRAGTIRRKAMRDGEHAGFWVQTRMRVDDDRGEEPFTFDQLNPAGGTAMAMGGRDPWAENRPAVLDAEFTVREGDGVEVTQDGTNWHDGYCTQILGGRYTVYLADKMIREHYPNSSLVVGEEQVRTDDATRERLGARKTKSSKRDYSASELVSGEALTGARYSEVAPLLLRNPAAFGQLLRTGGHVGRQEVEAVAKGQGIELTFPRGVRGKAPGKPPANGIVANDTYAMLATRLDDLEEGPGDWVVHGRAASAEAQDHPRLTETVLAGMKSIDMGEFRARYIFQQGSPAGEHLELPGGDRRKKMHAEAKVVRSVTWRHVVEDTISEFPAPSGKTEEPHPLPGRRKVISVVINRSSCGAKKDSGFAGGCAGELAAVAAEFWQTLAARLGKQWAARLRDSGRVRLEVSVGGEYEKPGRSENIFDSGAVVRTHPTYDFASDMPEPLSRAKHEFMARLAKLERESRPGSGDEEIPWQKLLAGMPPARKPVSRTQLQYGQASVTGQVHTGHGGRIACTSIAACALQQLLATPQMNVDAAAVLGFMRTGTDVDARLRGLPDPVAQDEQGAESGEQPMVIESRTMEVESGGATGAGRQGAEEEKAQEMEEEMAERYFAHDEVQDQFPGMEVHQDAVNALEPQYLYGVRGDYRRIARQLAAMGTGTGLLVTIGGATLMVANITQGMAGPTYALFDSHGNAVYETYDSEEELTDAIDELYPALPGVGEAAGVWQATPYRPAAGGGPGAGGVGGVG